jgi:hypothetical protein
MSFTPPLPASCILFTVYFLFLPFLPHDTLTLTLPKVHLKTEATLRHDGSVTPFVKYVVVYHSMIFIFDSFC